jgi:capsular exopolysaccharide synthesis family protein
MDFWRAVEILGKRKWLILLSVVITTALTFGATRLVGSKWLASVRFFAPPESIYTSSPENPMASGARGPEQIIAKNQAEIYTAVVKSPEVLQPALIRLNMTTLPPDLLENIKFESSSQRLFELQVSDASPERAGALANALADSFVAAHNKLFTQQARRVVDTLEGQLQQVDGRLSHARKDYDDYCKAHGLVGPLDMTLNPVVSRLQQARQKSDDAREKLADARARLRRAESQLAQMPETVAVERPVSSSPLVKTLEDELAQAEKKVTILRSTKTDQNIDVQLAVAQRDALQKRFNEEISKQPKTLARQANPERAPVEQTVRELRQEVSGYEAQVQELEGTMTRAQVDISKFTGVSGPLAQLTSEITGQTQQRTELAARLQNARMALDGAQRTQPIEVIDRVSALNPPINTTEGRTKKLLLLATLGSLVLISALIIAFDSIDRRIRTLPEAELALPARVIAAIPQPLGAVTAGTLARAAELHPLSMHSEAYRFLAVHLLAERERGVRSLMVASAKADQGTTATATNLAITLAQAGQRVVLVDANLRTPQVHQVFGLSNEVGFATLLHKVDAEALERALQPTPVPNLRVVTSGEAAGNPWELFRSDSVAQVSQRLRDLADYVVYDTPSALAFTDALNLAPAVDAALLCVRALETTSSAEQRLVELLEQRDVTVLGSVLSDVPASVLESYQNYQRYYPATPNGGSGGHLPGAGGNGPAAALAEGPAPATGAGASWIQVPGKGPGGGAEGLN